jgi:hypothetical protein
MAHKKSVLLVLVLAILVFVSCDNDLKQTTKDVTVQFTTVNRSIDVDYSVTSYLLKGTGPNSTTIVKEIDENSFILKALPIGKWSFDVTAYDSADVALASGEVEVVITKQTNTIAIELDNLVGSGDISISVDWNSEQSYGDQKLSYTLKELDGTLFKSEIDNSGDKSFTFEEVPAGFYLLEVNLICDGDVISGFIEAVRVLNERVSSVDKTLIIGLLANENHFSIIDNTGSIIEGAIGIDNQQLEIGDSAKLTFVLDSSNLNEEHLSCLWYCDGQLIEGENDLSYTIESLIGGTRRYDVVVKLEDVGSIGSATFLVEVPYEIGFID